MCRRPPSAYGNIQAIQTEVPFGQYIRNVHRWSAHLMVIAVAAHMARVFYRGAYKSPKEFNWVIGVLLLVVTLLMSFTGYLLPWDQLALLGGHGRNRHGLLRSTDWRTGQGTLARGPFGWIGHPACGSTCCMSRCFRSPSWVWSPSTCGAGARIRC